MDGSWFNQALERVAEMRKHTVGFALAPTGPRGPMIICTLEDGAKLVGRFKLGNGRVGEVIVDSGAR